MCFLSGTTSADGLSGAAVAFTELKMRLAVPIVPGVFPGVRPGAGRFKAGVRAGVRDGVFEAITGGSIPLSWASSVFAACKATSRDSTRACAADDFDLDVARAL